MDGWMDEAEHAGTGLHQIRSLELNDAEVFQYTTV